MIHGGGSGVKRGGARGSERSVRQHGQLDATGAWQKEGWVGDKRGVR